MALKHRRISEWNRSLKLWLWIPGQRDMLGVYSYYCCCYCISTPFFLVSFPKSGSVFDPKCFWVCLGFLHGAFSLFLPWESNWADDGKGPGGINNIHLLARFIPLRGHSQARRRDFAWGHFATKDGDIRQVKSFLSDWLAENCRLSRRRSQPRSVHPGVSSAGCQPLVFLTCSIYVQSVANVYLSGLLALTFP